MSGIGVITNPKAKRNLKRPWIKDTLQRIVGDTGGVYETRSIDELPALAHKFIEKGVDLVAVNGGDGTVHIALSHFIPIYRKLNVPLPRIMSLRGGTMNTISNSIKHKGTAEEILSSVVAKYRAGKPLDVIRQPILKINDKYGFMWGYGVVGNFLEQYYKGSNLGPWQAFKTFATIAASALFGTSLSKNLFGNRESVLDFDGKVMDLPDCKAILACSIVEVGLGFKMCYRAYEKPGYVHLRGITMPPSKFVLYLPWVFRGVRAPNDAILDELARVIKIKTKGNAAYTVDGEMYKDTDTFEVTQGPVLNIVREGRGKLPAGIGMPADWDKRAIEPNSPDKVEIFTDTHQKSESVLTL